MAECIGYVVITYNQASRMPEDEIEGGLHSDLADAEFACELMTQETADVGRGERHVVCRVVPVEDGDDG
jgi:hypothetical protein